MSTDVNEASLESVVICLREVESEAERLLAEHDGIHNMHGARWGIRGGIHNIQEGLYHDDSKRSFSGRFDAMANMDYLIRTMRQCAALGRYPTKAERLPHREIRRWQDVGR
jgi:hypothetical protein